MTIGDIIIIVLIVFYFFLESYLKKKGENKADKQDSREISYESEKGKNTATKEDVQVITEKVESIKNNFNESIEQLKADLKKRIITYEIAYSVYYNERSKSLIDLYKKLVVFYDSCTQLTSLWEVVQERGQSLSDYQESHKNRLDFHAEASHELKKEIDMNRLYLNDQLIAKLNDFHISTSNLSKKFWSIDVDASYDKETLREDCKNLYNYAIEFDEFAKTIRDLILPDK